MPKNQQDCNVSHQPDDRNTQKHKSRSMYARRLLPWFRVSGAALAAGGFGTAGYALSDDHKRLQRQPSESKDLRGPLHRLNPELAAQGRADVPRSLGARRSPKETTVVRVVMTGGPCAGKSSSLARITAAATAEGFDVYAAPETATVLFNSGCTFPAPGDANFDDRLFYFQKNLAKMQLQLERSMTSIAASTGRPSIIVFDRGLLDGKGYMEPAVWERVRAELDKEVGGITEEYILRRYDGVLHLTTAADGAVDYYKWGHVTDDAGNAVYRMETPKQAIELDRKMRECWKEHPRHLVIGNGAGGFEEKLEVAVKAVLQLARTTHPAK